MKNISIKNLLFFYTLVVTTILYGQNTELSHFETFKTFGGRPFTLHTDLVTENLSPVSSGLIYSTYDKEYLSSLNGDSLTPWEGGVCYFPKEIWSNTAAKIKYAEDGNNWIPLTCVLGGSYIHTPYLYTAVEMNELNETSGFWFLHDQTDSTRDGHWWNGGDFDDVSKKFVSYYVKFK